MVPHSGRAALMVVAALAAALVTPVAGGASGGVGDAVVPGRCGALQEIPLPLGKYACTHGPDPAPEGVDPDRPFDPDSANG
ncbi:MAG TPA: hypothetical protein VI854_03005, partial [Acidimicrobiia bacterium]|nr:hypothetical protein [Acidimicrobiia bacterium]